jgi:hydrogenase maturation protein HypF
LVVRGAVQGVGFRPYVHRLATEENLNGFVLNGPAGVRIEVEGRRGRVESFLARLPAELPPASFLQGLESSFLDVVGYRGFTIEPSEAGSPSTIVLPDIATCAECLKEIFDPGNRRYRYPFTNCTHCGPRFSIIQSMPYDRGNTSMAGFTQCPNCLGEYENPEDRRFHAQPNACPDCGPHLSLWDESGRVLTEREAALQRAAVEIRQGRIVAVKGLGGFHLLADARNPEAVGLLRQRKNREEKPFALMVSSLAEAKSLCRMASSEERLLLSPEHPIVLLDRLPEESPRIAFEVAPHNPTLGVMLPYTPLHHLLLTDLGFGVIATSGNLSDEPICIDEREALGRLHGIADYFLVHNRPILRPVDDSIARVMAGREGVLRRARGYAPFPIPLAFEVTPTLAVGAHLKSSIVLARGREAVVSQHLGDLETAESYRAFLAAIRDLRGLYDLHPDKVARDLHPDYLSSKQAEEMGCETFAVQHHLAHVYSCMAENELEPPVAGVAWDGAGLGLDRSVWGGEFFEILDSTSERVATLRSFPLPGGDAAAREPRRSALGLLFEMGKQGSSVYEAWLEKEFSIAESKVVSQMLEKGFQTPRCTSVGRLFDAVSALLGIRKVSTFEGQAAMELEFAAVGQSTDETFPVCFSKGAKGETIALDWEAMMAAMLVERDAGMEVGILARKFHNTLTAAIVEIAKRIGIHKVALSGGCFQNRLLLEKTVEGLRGAGFQPYWHQRVPPNDGGVALGQVYALARAGAEERD